MRLETERLCLRPWRQDDADELYELAKDPRVGPAAGWPVHTGVENSRQIIREVLSAEGTFAVELKKEGRVVGSIGLMRREQSNLSIKANEAEIGYWVGVPYWGQGIIPEAVRELLRYGFEELALDCIWCGYFEGNEKSRRVQEKCGFCFQRTEKEKPWPLTGEIHTEHITCITKEEWRKNNKKN